MEWYDKVIAFDLCASKPGSKEGGQSLDHNAESLNSILQPFSRFIKDP